MRLAGLSFLLALVCQAYQDEGSRTALLSRAIETMRHAVARMPDYTCTETISRYIGEGTPPRFDTLERIRLAVGVIEGKEMFSWPGPVPFERDNPRDVVGGGLTGIGDYADFSRSVFGSDAAEFTNSEEVLWQGKRSVKYDYRVPLNRSGYNLRIGADRAIVAYGGSVWVDPATERVLGMEVVADYRRSNIPEALDISGVKTLLEYKQIPFAGEELPFPTTSTVTVTRRRSSIVTSNRIEFSACRQYTAQSSIRFGDHNPAASIDSSPPRQSELPDDLFFEVALDKPIHVASSAAGDPVLATLVRRVKEGKLQIPKGAQFSGRILRMETDLDKDTTHVQIGFSHLQSAELIFPLRARFVMFKSVPGVISGPPKRGKWFNFRDAPGAPEWKTRVDLTLIGKDALLPTGFRMEWITVPNSRPGRK